MELNILFNETTGIVMAKAIGDIVKENIHTTIIEGINAGNRHGSNRLLFDITECAVGQSLAEGLAAMENIAKLPGMTYLHRVAIIFDPAKYPSERAHFIENVVNNRPNPAYRVFTAEKAAIDWLLAAK
jgi:hypothetical protein